MIDRGMMINHYTIEAPSEKGVVRERAGDLRWVREKREGYKREIM